MNYTIRNPDDRKVPPCEIILKNGWEQNDGIRASPFAAPSDWRDPGNVHHSCQHVNKGKWARVRWKNTAPPPVSQPTSWPWVWWDPWIQLPISRRTENRKCVELHMRTQSVTPAWDTPQLKWPQFWMFIYKNFLVGETTVFRTATFD